MLALPTLTVQSIAPSLEGRSWVAFLQLQAPPSSFVKIEATKTLVARLRQLDRDLPYETRLIGLIETVNPAEAVRAIQREYETARFRGEWFRPELPLLTFIERSGQRDLRDIVAHLEPSKSGTIGVAELAEQLNVSVPTIRRMVSDKRIPALAVRGQIRFVLSEVLSHLRRA